MALKKTYYPAKTFDDDLDGLARLFQSKGWEFSGVDTTALIAGAEEQRTERAEHDALRREYAAMHEKFGLAQLARFTLFVTALRAARAVFRNDKAVTAELERFHRSSVRAKKVQDEAA
ncbi:MAG: hypothetical protein M0R80_14095 [Proteobacteria bacterium]|nr:hypothetical protein [Pseudomonadota bacterium]